MDAVTLNSHLPYCFGNEISYLKQLGSQLTSDAQVVMLGIGPGVMALALLEGSQQPFTFYGADLYDFTAVEHLNAAGREGQLQVHPSDSAAFSTYFRPHSVDMVLVDACHTYPCVKGDIQAWLPKIKPGGIWFFHDYVPQPNDAPDNGVARAVEEFRSQLGDELDRPGCSIVFRMPL